MNPGQIRACWVAADGIVYKHFKESMVVGKLPSIKRYFAGVDWGYDHYGVILIFGEDHDGNVYLIDETAERGQEIDFWENEQKKYIAKYGRMKFYCDSARPEYVKRLKGVNAKKEVVEGIDTVARFMKDEKFYVLKGAAKRWMQEVYSYVWMDNNKKEEPEKENDDAMDAMRYALHTQYGRGKSMQFRKSL